MVKHSPCNSTQNRSQKTHCDSNSLTECTCQKLNWQKLPGLSQCLHASSKGTDKPRKLTYFTSFLRESPGWQLCSWFSVRRVWVPVPHHWCSFSFRSRGTVFLWSVTEPPSTFSKITSWWNSIAFVHALHERMLQMSKGTWKKVTEMTQWQEKTNFHNGNLTEVNDFVLPEKSKIQ